MKTFKAYKRKILTKEPSYQGYLDTTDEWLTHMCKTCGYPLGCHFSGNIHARSEIDYDGVCPIEENNKSKPTRYYRGSYILIDPIFYPEELNINTKVL